jgi:four helix bundle protein
MHRYRELKVWQEAVSLAFEIAECVRNFPSGERYGISDQLKRAAVSVASNIAEGAGRNSAIDFKRFLSIANGSLFEVDTQLEICLRLGLIDQELHSKFSQRIGFIGNMIFRFQQHLDNEGKKSNYVNDVEEIYEINHNFDDDNALYYLEQKNLKYNTKPEY